MKQLRKQFKSGSLAPSLLSADFSELKSEVKDVESAGASWLHLDVMDGHFVPNLTFGPMLVAAVAKHTKMLLDCHLMIEKPELWVGAFAKAGADLITVHAESTHHLDRLVHGVKELGVLAGVSINPATPLGAIEEVLDEVDLVLLMSVNPGFGGQKFIESAISRVERLNEMRSGRKFLIQVDGGIGIENIARLRRAGCDVFVAGSSIFGKSNRKKAVKDLLRVMASG